MPDNGEEKSIYERNYVYFKNSGLFMNKVESASFTEHINNTFKNAFEQNVKRLTIAYLELNCIPLCHESCLIC